MIRIDVTTDPHPESGLKQVTRMEGTAGIAICIQTTDLEQFTVDPESAIAVMLAQPQMPTVAIRAENAMELALMLAGIISTVHEANPAVLHTALRLARLMDAGNPLLKKEYPK